MDSLTYRQEGDYLVPDLALPPQPEVQLGRIARARKEFLMNHRKALFTDLLTTCTLTQHLAEIEETAWTRIERITAQMAAAQGATEELKARDQMKWLGMMGNIRQAAEDTIYRELVYN